MKTYFYLLAFFIITYNSFSQAPGTDFWLSIPYINKSINENLRGSTTNSPYELFVTTTQPANILLYDKSGEVLKAKYIEGNSSFIMAIDESYMNSESEVIRSNSLHLVSDVPVNVAIFVSYQWTGAAITILPTELLGNEYYTMNFYEDKLKDVDGSIKYTQPAILILATENGTSVNFTPTVKTEKNVSAGSTKNINLNKGQVYLIKSTENANLSQTWESDLTGTYINSNKPIAVFSGHSKSTFPRLAATFLGMRADFSRGTYLEQMLPFKFAGCEYVSVPITYQGRNYYGNYQEDRGEIIRFVATENNTTIYINNEITSDLVKMATINKGQDFKIMEQTKTGYYYADKKVLVSQYAKSHTNNVHPVTPGKINKIFDIDGDDNVTLGYCGQGMMMTLIPNNLWVSSTSFYTTTSQMYKYLCIVFKTKDKDKIKLDGSSIAQDYASKIKLINGSAYSYLVIIISKGSHNIEADNNKVRFAAYYYGNLDGFDDGFAYGSFCGIYDDKSCDDSLKFDYYTDCSSYYIHANSFDKDTNQNCSNIKNALSDLNYTTNAELKNNPNKTNTDKDKYFIASPLDKSKPAHIVVIADTYSGNTDTLEIDFVPEKLVEASAEIIDFGIQARNKEFIQNIEIENISSTQISIKKLFFKNSTKEFSVSNSLNQNFKIKEKKKFEIKALMTDESNTYLVDTLIAEFDCFHNQLFEVRISAGIPNVISSNISIQNISPFYDNFELALLISNLGSGEALIDNIVFDNNDNFSLSKSPFSKLRIAPESTDTVYLNYNSNHQTNATHKALGTIICSNASPTNSTFDIQCSTSISIFSLESYDWANKKITIENNQNPATLKLLNCCDSGEVKIHQITIESDIADIFTIDEASYTSILNTIVNENAEKNLIVYFSPKDTINYNAQLKIVLEKHNTLLSVSSNLIGKGVAINSVNDNTDQTKLRVKPNPISANTIISYELECETAIEINMFDMSGKLIENIYSDYSNLGYNEIDISNVVSKLSNGIYNVVLKSDNFENNIRFVVNR